jgi:hypothetical protein
MSLKTRSAWTALLATNVVSLGMLGFYQTTTAAPPQAQEPFANAVQQRFESIGVLREISALLKEQNALLRSGKLEVVIVGVHQPNTDP